MAALIVVMAHCYLIALPHLGTGAGSVGWMLGSTPMNVIVDGSDAVLVFFLLSGLVVALPSMRPGFDWRAYYPRRIVRLYLPVLASVLFAVVLIIAIPRDNIPPGQWAADASAASIEPGQLVIESMLLTISPTINNPLWSLTWEVLFSLLLPAFVWVAMRTASWWVAAIALCVVVRVAGNAADLGALVYLPVFLIGTIAAANFEQVQAAAAAINRQRLRALTWGAISLGSVLALTASSALQGLGIDDGPMVALARQLPILGAAGLVFTAIGCAQGVKALESRPVQWLGRISFSLYLVHVPVLVTALAFFGVTRWWAALLVGVPASFSVAWVFERVVEMPSHRLSKAVGRRVARRVVLT